MQHTTVLLNGAVDALLWDEHGLYVDATFGRGGHTRALLARLAADARVLAFDKDPQALEAAAAISDARFSAQQASFTALGDLPSASVAGVLMDLGVSSPQIDTPSRGFSFRGDWPLDMRMDTTRGQTAAQWLAHASEREIAEVIRVYGEERFAGAIAAALVARRRQEGPLASTLELARLVASAVKTREPGQHPATRTFQAIRIH